MFLNAYMSVQQGEKLEGEGQLKAALAKYRFAASALDQVHQKFPQWQPLIVEYRKKRTAESIARLEGKIGKGGSGVAPGAPRGNPAFPLDDGMEPLPERGDGIAPPSLVVSPAEVEAAEDGTDPAIQGLQQRMKQLQTQLRESRAQLETVQRENEELTTKLSASLKKQKGSGESEAQLRAGLEQAEAALKKATAAESKDAQGTKGFEKEIARLKNALAEARIERDVIDDETDDLARRVARARKQAELVAKERDAARDEGGAVRKTNEDLTGQLAKAQTEIGVIGRERDVIAKQRDQALADLDKAKQAQQQVDKLLADNSSLMQRLSEAEKTIQAFNADAPEKDKAIASLRKEVGTVMEQLAGAQKQSEEFHGSMVDLQAQLEKATADLARAKAGGSNAEERKKFAEENELLRAIVLRELKEGARRGQAKKLVVEELKKLEVQSTALLDQIDYLGQPTIKLTEQERALFKPAEIDLIDNEPPAVALSIAAPKSDKGPAPKPQEHKETAGTGKEQGAQAKKLQDGRKTAAATEDTPVVSVSPAEPAAATPQDPEAFDSGKMDLTAGARNAANPGKKPVPGTTTEADPELPVKPAPGEEAAAGAAPLVESGPPVPNVPEELLPLTRDAKEAFDRGQYADAEKIYTRLLSKAPNNLYILSNLGVTRYRSGKLRLAEETFKKAIAIAPGDSFCHCTLGIIYYSQNRFEEAITELTKALDVNPRMATAHNYLGITASQKGWMDAAVRELEAAIAIDPNYADAFFNLAVVYTTQQPSNKELARKNYQRALELGADADTSLEQLIK